MKKRGANDKDHKGSCIVRFFIFIFLSRGVFCLEKKKMSRSGMTVGDGLFAASNAYLIGKMADKDPKGAESVMKTQAKWGAIVAIVFVGVFLIIAAIAMFHSGSFGSSDTTTNTNPPPMMTSSPDPKHPQASSSMSK
jgi:hypothetical protein